MPICLYAKQTREPPLCLYKTCICSIHSGRYIKQNRCPFDLHPQIVKYLMQPINLSMLQKIIVLHYREISGVGGPWTGHTNIFPRLHEPGISISPYLPRSVGNSIIFHMDPKWFCNISLTILYALKLFLWSKGWRVINLEIGVAGQTRGEGSETLYTTFNGLWEIINSRIIRKNLEKGSATF